MLGSREGRKEPHVQGQVFCELKQNMQFINIKHVKVFNPPVRNDK